VINQMKGPGQTVSKTGPFLVARRRGPSRRRCSAPSIGSVAQLSGHHVHVNSATLSQHRHTALGISHPVNGRHEIPISLVGARTP
jgi:hypothetical protein